MINKLFKTLDDWRNLPSYQLERRADIFFAIHLKKIIEYKLETKIDYIIPEFPIKKDSLPEHSKFNKKPLKRPNQSFHVDYLAYSKESEKVYLIELKTDEISRNDKQDWYLEEATNLKVQGLVKGLTEIFKATKQKQKQKYKNLLDQIEKIGWVEKDENNKWIKSDIKIIPSVIYIQPLNKDNEDNENNIISFEDVKKALSDSEDSLTKRFVDSLETWKTNPNK